MTVDARGIAEHFIGSAPAVKFAAGRLGGEYVTKLKSGSNPPILGVSARWNPALVLNKVWQARAVTVVPVGKAFGVNFSVADDYLENTPEKIIPHRVGLDEHFRWVSSPGCSRIQGSSHSGSCGAGPSETNRKL